MKNVIFNLKEAEYIEMIKILKIYKLVSSGGEAKIRIENGEVTRNGTVEHRKRAKIRVGESIQFKDYNISIEL